MNDALKTYHCAGDGMCIDPRCPTHSPPEMRRVAGEKVAAHLDVLDIHTWRDDSAPPDERWHACLGEYDLGTRVFSGRYQREAIDELLDFYEDADGEICQ